MSGGVGMWACGIAVTCVTDADCQTTTHHTQVGVRDHQQSFACLAAAVMHGCGRVVCLLGRRQPPQWRH